MFLNGRQLQILEAVAHRADWLHALDNHGKS